MDRVPLEEQYEMCGLFKQSTFGDIDIKCRLKLPNTSQDVSRGGETRKLDHKQSRILMSDDLKQSSILLPVAGSQGHVLRNCQAWQANRGLSKPDAIRKYVTKADQLVAHYKG